MKDIIKFLFLGLLIAILEEFITQGVLKNTLFLWIIPTFLAFGPFLIITYFIKKLLEKRYFEPKAMLIYYLVAGCVGIFIEWFIIGLGPWTSPNIFQIPFQLGIFSFWGSVAFGPRLLLDLRTIILNIRKGYTRILLLGFALIYFIALTTTPADKRFIFTIIAVMVFFIGLNYFYYKYIKKLQEQDLSDKLEHNLL